jgi:pimeloyl-ACP methyl ester carboxylesterase
VIVFVHGVPETAAIWDKVRAAVGEASVAVPLPGFGCQRPAGFGATKDEYVDWLVGEIDRIGGPVDLVGHDWGALLTYRIAAAHGDRVRSWVADIGSVVHPHYEWHAVAKVWQTLGDGEAFVEGQDALAPQDRAMLYQGFGLDADDALELATGADRTMGECILDLYRSAVPNLHADWGPWSPTSAPGLVLHPVDDTFSDGGLARESAATFGARFEVLDGAGHFWPYQAPDAAAAVLLEFWSTLA